MDEKEIKGDIRMQKAYEASTQTEKMSLTTK
jgi:hypothetical protein